MRADEPTRSWSITVLTRGFAEDLERCVTSAVRWMPDDAEVLVLEQGSDGATARRARELEDGGRVRVVLADRDLGEGAGRNALLRIARGALLLQLDPSVEITADLFSVRRITSKSKSTAIVHGAVPQVSPFQSPGRAERCPSRRARWCRNRAATRSP